MVLQLTEQEADTMSVSPQTVVDVALHELLRYEEILGVIAVSADGLVIGSAGVDEDDADFLSVLGASLVGVAERTSRRTGAGSALSLSITAYDGMVTVRNAGTFALAIFSEHADPNLISKVSQPALVQVATMLDPG